jgi:hypothetical protein
LEKEGCGGSGDCARFLSFFSGFKWWAKICGGGGNRRRRLRRERSVLAEASGFFLFNGFCSVLAPLCWFLPEDFDFSEFASVTVDGQKI